MEAQEGQGWSSSERVSMLSQTRVHEWLGGFAHVVLTKEGKLPYMALLRRIPKGQECRGSYLEI